MSGNGFTEGENRTKHVAMKATDEIELSSPRSIERMQNELLYLWQEVVFLKNHYSGEFKEERLIMETSNNKFEIIHETIQKSNNQLSVKMLCEIAGVSRSGYYNWVNAVKKRAKKEA